MRRKTKSGLWAPNVRDTYMNHQELHRKRTYMGPQPNYKDEQDVRCWCGKKTVKVSTEDVRAGKTASCGRENCKG